MNKFFSFSIVLLLISLLPLVGSSALLYLVATHPDFFNFSHVQLFCFFFVMIFTMTFALTPTTFVAFLSGYFFSWVGLAIMTIAYMISSVLGLSLGKYIGKNVLDNYLEHKPTWKKFVSSMEKRVFRLVVFARLSPVLPFAMMNVALSQVKIKRSNYLFGTFLGMLPRTVLFFWAGKNAEQIIQFFEHPAGDGFSRLLPMLLIVISFLGLFYIARKSWKETEQ